MSTKKLQILNGLDFVRYNEQTLTDEQKAQVRENIGAGSSDSVTADELNGYLYYKQPPIYRIEETGNAMNIYINLADLVNGGYYYFNTALQVPESTAGMYSLYYIVACKDGTEFNVSTSQGTKGYNLGAPFKINNFTAMSYMPNPIVIQFEDTYTRQITVGGTIDTATNLTKTTTYNSKYLSTQNQYEYIPTKDYHPSTKKYVDDAAATVNESVNAVSALVGDVSVATQINDALLNSQADWNQNDSSADNYVKNRPFYELTGTLTWDGNTDGLVSVADAFYKVADAVLSLSDVANGYSVVVPAFGTVTEVDTPPEEIADGIVLIGGAIVSVAESGVGVDVDGLSFPEAGTYFMKTVDVCVGSLTINGYTGFITVKKIDPKYLYNADWSVNDEISPAYVKNRPFYEEDGVVHTLDAKYLPEEYATVTEMEAVQTAVEAAQSTADNNAINLLTLKNITAAMPISSIWRSITYGNGKFVVMGASSNAAYSEDGITWTATTMPSSTDWESVAYGNGKFVVVASDSIVAYSEDGITWVQITTPSSPWLSRVTYGNGKFVAVASNSNRVAYSEDGITWRNDCDIFTQNAEDVTDTLKNVLVGCDPIPNPETATVGQTIVVKTVDENGKPTEWECVDMVSDDGSSVTVDTTLSVSGQAADSATVGEKVTELTNAVAGKQPIGTYIQTVNGVAPDENGNVEVPSVTVTDDGEGNVVLGSVLVTSYAEDVSF